MPRSATYENVASAIAEKTRQLLESFEEKREIGFAKLKSTDNPEELFGWLKKFKDLPENIRIRFQCGNCVLPYSPPVIIDWYNMPFSPYGSGKWWEECIIFQSENPHTKKITNHLKAIYIPAIFFVSFILAMREYCQREQILWRFYKEKKVIK